MLSPKGEFDFLLGGQRVHIRLGHPDDAGLSPSTAPPPRPLADWSDEELAARVGQVVTTIDALDSELRSLRGEQKRRRSV